VQAGTNPAAPLLPEIGPLELRAIVRTFNDVLARLRRFADDRTQMVAAMSHDFRTPLTRLRLRADYVGDAEQQTKMLSDIAEMDDMIEATLAFSGEEARAEPYQPMDIATLVASVCDDMADLGRDVTCEVPAHVIIAGRASAMRRAFTNLVDNAIKYGARASIRLRETAANIEVTVTDEGPGIPPTEFEKVFAPFYRLERSRSRGTGGAGLGLAVAPTIVRAHGGEIELSNDSPRGLLVTVRLPRNLKR
jgi:signal transduction histidine kinase